MACEFSGEVRRAFARRGHLVVSCDLLQSDDGAPWGVRDSPIGNHYQGDVRRLLVKARQRWDLLLAFPPCTRLCNSGVRWLEERGLHAELEQAAAFFRMFIEADVPRIAVENPTMHRYARALVGLAPTQVIHPWQYGHGETKRTCLWLRYLPPLVPTRVVAGRVARVHRMPPSANRANERSRFYTGWARAMAARWG